MQSAMYSSQCKFSNIYNRETEGERDETRGKRGVGVLGKSGRPTFSIKTIGFFSEDILNHPQSVYTVNNSFREKSNII